MAWPELAGARAKIERAKKHIRDLDREKTTFLASDAYKVTPEFYVEQNTTAYFLDECLSMPNGISLLIGDAAHNLRTALDYLACSLIPSVAGKAPASHIYFPICKGLKEYKTESRGKTKGMPETFKQRIDAFKPYGGGDNRLWGLHQLDIADKHRLLTTTITTVHTLNFTINTDIVNRAFGGHLVFPVGLIKQQTVHIPALKPIFPIEKGAMLYSIAGDHETNKDVNLTFDIAFGQSEVFEGQLVVKTLSELADLVEGIVESFCLIVR
jgi:hypothetical protein